jgi:hypothetical protein
MRPAGLLFLLAFTCGIAAFSCTTNDAAPGTDGGTSQTVEPTKGAGLPCDVDAVLEKNCRSCHGATPLHGAPMPLVTHGDLTAVSPIDASAHIADRVAARIHDGAKPMPPPPNAPLTAADMATLDRWIAGGAQRVDEACGSSAPPPPVTTTPLSCTPDVHMKPTSSWTMPADTDDEYVCYGFDVTAAQKRHLTAIAPLIDNPAIVHHLVLFESSHTVSGVPQPCNEATSAQMRILYGWAPGGKALELPAEAGFAQEGTIHYVVQVHYNNVQHKSGQTDASGFDFCTTDQLRPNDADGVVFGTTSISIPAHGASDISCRYAVPNELNGAHLFASMPHMHQLGTSIATSLTKKGASAPQDIGSRTAWDFGNQPYEAISATLGAGDTVTTRCAWKNPSDKSVGFGPYTEDEMCFSFMMYYPKIQSTQWSWMMPAIRSSCAPTP